MKRKTIYPIILTLFALLTSSGSSMRISPTVPQQLDEQTPVVKKAEDNAVRSSLPEKIENDILQENRQFYFGFNPQEDAFNFPNYGNSPEITNLTPVEIRRMFGDQACARFSPNEEPGCILILPARQFMEEMNALMENGRCEGLAVLSLFFHSGLIDVTEFGAESASELTLEDNEALQREIAYWFTTQVTTPTKDQIIRAAPNEILSVLASAFEQDIQETYTIGIYKSDMTGGHSLTPYAIEWQGENTFWQYVDDSNYPQENPYIILNLRSCRRKSAWG